MSFPWEESPISDSKMDISDGTTSIESMGASPSAEDEELEQRNHSNDNSNTLLIKGLIMENDTTHTEAVNLDNRSMNGEIFSLEPASQRNNILRTITVSHPLMSPNGTDSESEHCHDKNKVSMDLKHHNFPDVVPHRERLHTTSINDVKVRNSKNSVHGKNASGPISHNKLTALRTESPDLLSSESEADLSQYHTTVEPNFQAVALVSNTSNGSVCKGARIYKKPSDNGAGADDISSLDSISNHSFDDDDAGEHNLASLSPSSSLIDGLDDDDDDADDDNDCEDPKLLPDIEHSPGTQTPTPSKRLPQAAKAIPQYSAAEEIRESRNWHKITLPDGTTREIDMRVIEPYKRVLSHGGYLKAGGHNAIVIFCACHLPDRSRADYNYVMDNLFLYVVKTLEQLITEDYVLIYLHGGSSRRNVPPFPWIKKCYQLLDRRLRKSLKNMYLVHPTFWVKSIVWMTRPFVSAKFWRKLIYVKSLDELNEYLAVEKAAIPEKVKQYDAKHN